MFDTEAQINPFPGLRPFEEEEDYLFFGREQHTDELLTKLRTSRFLAVVGTSGSGKSSLVKCGLLPSLYGGYMATAGSSWRILVCRPGNDPIGNLAEGLAQPEALYPDAEEEEASTYASIIQATLRRSNLGLTEAVRQAHLPEHENLLVVVDQFEELFRFSRYEKQSGTGQRDSSAFVDLLLKASAQKELPIYITITMRSDFLGDCTQFRGLPEAINAGQYLIPRLTREEIKQAIMGPVAVSGAEISQRLITRLLNDIGDNQDQLPILQHALMRTWEHWHEQDQPNTPIDLDDYVAIGTMKMALSQHADEAYADLGHDEGIKNLCQQLFKALTDKGSDARGIRRPSKAVEIMGLTDATLEQVGKVVNTFRKEGRAFLMPPAEVPLTEETVIDISHESLMRVWQRLIGWVDDENRSAQIYLRLANAAALQQQGDGGLWRDPELQIGTRWYERENPKEAWALRYDPSFDRAIAFLQASQRKQQSELAMAEKRRRRKLRNTRLVAAFMGLAALIAIFLGGYGLEQARMALEANDKAVGSALDAELRSVMQKHDKYRADFLAQSAVMSREELAVALVEAEEAREEIDKQNTKLVAAFNTIQSALFAKDVADAQREVADSLRQVALNNAETAAANANAQRRKTDTLNNLINAQLLANRAEELIYSGEVALGRALALHAFEIHQNNKGPQQQNAIYRAMWASVFGSAPQPAYNRVYPSSANQGYDVRVMRPLDNGLLLTGNDQGVTSLWKCLPDSGFVQQASAQIQSPVRAITTLDLPNAVLMANRDGGIYYWSFQKPGYKAVKVLDLEEGQIPYSMQLVQSNSTGRSYLVTMTQQVLYVHALNYATTALDSASTDAARKNRKAKSLDLSPNAPTLRLVQYQKAPQGGFYNSMAWHPAAFLGKEKAARLFVGTSQNQLLSFKLVNFKGNSPSLSVIEPADTLELPYTPSALAVEGNKGQLAVGTTSGRVLLFNLANTKRPKALTGHRSRISSVAFQPQTGKLVSASLDNSVRIWALNNASSREETLVLKGISNWVWQVGLLPQNPDYLVLTGQKGRIEYWPLNFEVMENDLCKAVNTRSYEVAGQTFIDREKDYERPNCK